MKRHEVLGILPFIAAGALGTTAFAEGDAQISPNTNTFETTPFGGGKVAGGCGDTSLTQSSSLDVVPGSVSCNAAGLHTDNGYYRVFRLSDDGLQPPFDVCSVTIGVEVATAGPDQNGEQPIIVRLYNTDESFDFDGTLIAESITTVADGGGVLADFPIDATIPGDAFVVEIFTPEGQTDGNSFFIGSNPEPESGLSYLAADGCGIAVPTPVGDIGFPDMHIVMQVNGNAGEDACPEDTNNDGVVDVQDLTAVILAWGSDDAAADVNNDGTVDVQDLTAVILAWGPCPIENDTCEDRTAIFVAGSYGFTNIGAGIDDPPFDCGSNVGADVWWNYTAPADGVLIVDTCGSGFDTVLELWGGFGCPPADLLGCNDDACDLQSSITLNVLAGDEVKIRVGGWDGAQGTGVLNVDFDEDIPEPPANDDCANAEALSVGQIVVGDTTNATGGEGPGTPEDAPFCGTSVDSPGVWYTVVGNGNELTASLCNGCPDACNTTYDAKIHVYCGTCGDFGCVGGDDDGCGVGGGPSTVTFCSEAGETYYILVEGWNGSTGVYELQVQNGAACDNPSCGSGNFSCETAAAINAGDNVNSDTCDGVASAPPVCTGGQTPLQGQWYVYTGDGNTATVSTCSTAPTGTIFFGTDIYCSGPEGAECGNLECIGSTSPSCNVFFTEQDFCTIAGNDYYIHVYAVQPGGFDECGEYLLEVTSDGAPCDDFTDCDQPGCADPSAGTTVIATTLLAGPSPLGITQDSNTGVIYSLQLFDRTWEAFTFDGAAYTSLGTTTFDPNLTSIPDTLGPPFASGISYDSVNNTLWIMIAQDQDGGVGWTMHEVDLDGEPTGATISNPTFSGLAADVEHDPDTDTFWYVDIVNDQVHNVNRAGTELGNVPQSCIDDGNGVFGNGCDISNGILEVLVGPISAPTADRAVPISQVDGSTLGDCPFTCDSVTNLDAGVLASTFTSGIVRDRMNPNVMHVQGSGGDFLTAVEAAPQPAP